jgi:hypothetical protein
LGGLKTWKNKKWYKLPSKSDWTLPKLRMHTLHFVKPEHPLDIWDNIWRKAKKLLEKNPAGYLFVVTDRDKSSQDPATASPFTREQCLAFVNFN